MQKASVFFFLIVCFILTDLSAFSQTTERKAINEIIQSFKDQNAKFPEESIYIQTDRAQYAAGDTLYFKAYLLNALLESSQKSGIAYLELVNSKNSIKTKVMLRMQGGVYSGYVVLPSETFTEGSYQLRAYTRYMFNFSPQRNFTRQIDIYGKEPPLLMRIANLPAGKDSTGLRLSLSDISNEPALLHSFSLRVMQGKETLFRKNVKTSLDGAVDIRFPGAKKDSSGTLTIIKSKSSDSTRYRNLSFTMPLNRPQNADVQFLPEGGWMVAGLLSRVAFKGVNEDGRGMPVSGTVFDSRNRAVADLRSVHGGMGTFLIRPSGGEKYTAKINLPGGEKKDFALPVVKPVGTILSASFLNDTTLSVELSASRAIAGRYLFIAQSAGVICFGSIVKLDSAKRKVILPTRYFPPGVARLTLFDLNKKPLNERSVFIPALDTMRIRLTPSKPVFALRDSVSVDVEVRDAGNRPVSGTFSMAVTDDGQVIADTPHTFPGFIHLERELQGEIENPSHYVQNTASARRDLDLLLLTHGWTGYPWDKIFSPGKGVQFTPETDLEVSGHVSNLLNRPVENSKLTLFSSKPFILKETLSNVKGDFRFADFPQIDTAAVFLLQAYNKRGKANNIGITINENQLPAIMNGLKRAYPWFVNLDTSRILPLKTSYVQKEVAEKAGANSRLLDEVKIVAKKIIKGSRNLNGAGNTDQALDEKDLEKAGKITLGELLMQKVKGFREGAILRPPPPTPAYMLQDKIVHLVFDGIDVEFSFQPFTGMRDERMRFLKEYLDYYTAEDIKGIEVMRSVRYVSQYTSRYMDPMVDPNFFAFIEITTRSGHGPFVRHTPGTYLYKPVPFAENKQFYKPKYSLKKAGNGGDVRPLIHWEPDIITDENGKARVWFYTSDRPGKFTIRLEGADLNGLIGSHQQKIQVK